MPIPMQCECGHYWEASDSAAGRPEKCAGCGETLIISQPGAAMEPMGPAGRGPGPTGMGPAQVAPQAMAYGHAFAPPEPPPPRGMAITGGILALLGGLGHAFIGFMLVILAAFLSAFVNALAGSSASGTAAKNEAFGILVLLFVYTGLCALSCIPAIMATLGRYWAVLVTAIFQALLTAGMVYLTVRSREWIIGAAAVYSGATLVFCVLGLRQARAHGDYERRRLEMIHSGGPGYP